MSDAKDNLTLLIREGEPVPSVRGLPMMRRVSDPGVTFPRLRRFFRPWRLIGRALLIGIPCWAVASLAAIGGWLTGLVASLAQSLVPYAEAGMSTATFFTVLPLGILALWAGVLGVRDAMALPRNRREEKAYRGALARLGDADVLTPADLRSPGIREGLVTLGHFEKLLASVDRERGRVSGLLLDSLHRSRDMVFRSVLDLIGTERRLAEWSGRLGEASTYRQKLEQRRDTLAGSYPAILDQCLHAADHALAHGGDDPADLQRSVDALLDSCTRALSAVDDTGPAIDEQELLMYAAKAREAEAQASPDDNETTAPEADRPG